MNNKSDYIKITDTISMSFEDYVARVSNYTFMESLIFSLDVKKYVNEHMNMNKVKTEAMLDNIYNHLVENYDNPIFDEFVKDNLYYLIDYFSEKDNKKVMEEQNELINKIKGLVNSLEGGHPDFLRQHILLREYAQINLLDFRFNNFMINRIPDETILDYRDTYYNSISNDFCVLDLLLAGDERFKKEYNDFLLFSDFYRSINYFMSLYGIMFSRDNYLEKVKFIIGCDNDLIKSGKIVDKDFKALQNVSKRMVRKLEKQFR